MTDKDRKTHIRTIEKMTDHRYLNMYHFHAKDKNDREFPYYVASRAQSVEELKAVSRKNIPNGVIVFAVYGEKKDRVVLVRQYRYPLDDYVYEFPAGLVEKDENYRTAAIREMQEETGLSFQPLSVDPMYERPFFTTVGMTDESCATVYGYAQGTPSVAGLEVSEDLEIVLADREEVRRILQKEKVAIMCAYMLMHFLADTEDEPFAFLMKK